MAYGRIAESRFRQIAPTPSVFQSRYREDPLQFFPAAVHGAFLSGVRAAYEIMLADAKADLMKDSQGEVDTYV